MLRTFANTLQETNSVLLLFIWKYSSSSSFIGWPWLLTSTRKYLPQWELPWAGIGLLGTCEKCSYDSEFKL